MICNIEQSNRNMILSIQKDLILILEERRRDRHLYELERASYHVGKSIFSGWKEYLLGLEKVSFRVLGSNFSIVATRLGNSAEPSQQVCRLQSAPLSSLVGTPCCRTTSPF